MTEPLHITTREELRRRYEENHDTAAEMVIKQHDRVLGLDLLKSFSIIFSMIGIHCMYDLTSLSASDGPLEAVLNVIATQFTAPVFMFCMGMTFVFSRHQDPGSYMRRGIRLLTFGMVLNVLRYLPEAYSAAKAGEENIFSGWAQIFNVDILQFAGLAFLLIALLKKFKTSHWTIFAIGLVMSVAGTLLDGCKTDSYVVNQVLGYFYPTPTCCCFPLLNWFIFVTTGNATGWIYRSGKAKAFLRIAAPTGALVTAVYMYLCLVVEAPFTRCLQNDWGYYSMHTPDALLTAFGIAPFMLGLFSLLSKTVPTKWEPFLSYPSRHINQYYCITWVLIMWTANLFLFVPKASTDAGFLVMWFMVVLLTTITVIIYNRFLRAGFKEFFGRHSIAWTIGVWTALILFGAWYFSTVPGPYTMPY